MRGLVLVCKFVYFLPLLILLLLYILFVFNCPDFLTFFFIACVAHQG